MSDERSKYGWSRNLHPLTCTCVDCVENRLNPPRAGTAPTTVDPAYHPPDCPCTACIYKLRARYLAAAKERPIEATGGGEIVGEQPPPETKALTAHSWQPRIHPHPPPEEVHPSSPVQSRAPTSATQIQRHADLRQPRRPRRRRLRYALALIVIVIGFIAGTVVVAGIALTDAEDDAMSKTSAWFEDIEDRPLIPGLPSAGAGADGEPPRVRRRGWLRHLFD